MRLKAINTLTGEIISVFDPTWTKDLWKLKELEQMKCLICEYCRQPLKLAPMKSKTLKRQLWTFKHLYNNPACDMDAETFDRKLQEWNTPPDELDEDF